MATFGDMKTWVSKRLQDPSNTAVSESDVGELINQAMGYWKNTRFFFNEVTDTTTLTTGDASIPLPADFLCPSIDSAFVIEYSGIRYPLKKVSGTIYNEIYLSNGIGQPYCFARQANIEYQVYPVPDRDYTLRRFYLKDYDDFVDDADTNDFSTEADRLLKYTAAAYGSRDFRQDAEMYNAFWAQAQQEKQDLLNQTRKENAAGSLATYF
jgi:hypothetical protein